MLTIHGVRRGTTSYRVLVCNMIAREKAELGLPVVESLRPWIKTREMTVAAGNETEAWEKALDLFPATEGFFVESVRPV